MVAILSLLTIFFPILALPFVILMIFFEKNILNKKVYCILFAIIVSFILYNMVPNSAMDIYRYYNMMDNLKNYDFLSFIKYAFDNIEPIMSFIFYLFSKTNDNNLILIFISLVSYFIHFYILFDYQKEKKLSNLEFNVVLLFFLSIFLIISITGVRQLLAKSIFFLAVYLDFYKKKKGPSLYVLYLLPIFIHQSSIILFILLLILRLNKNKFDYKFVILFIIIYITPSLLLEYTSIISSKFSFLGMLNQRASSYLLETNSFSNIYKLQFSLMIYMFIIILLVKRSKKTTNYKMLNYTLSTLCIALCFVNSLTISTRFITISAIYMVLLLMDFIKEINNLNKMLLSVSLIAFSLVYSLFQVIQLKQGTYPKLFSFNPKLFIIFTLVIIISIIILTNKEKNNKKSKVK